MTRICLFLLPLVVAVGCQPMPGTTSPGWNSRMGMGPQNRTLGNSAFNSVGFGESAYGRVAYGPSVSIPGLISPTGTTIAGGPSGGTTIQWDLNQAANPPGTGVPTGAGVSTGSLEAGVADQFQRLNADNTELYRQLASLQQQLQSTQSAEQELQQQLQLARSQLDQFQRLNQDAQQRLQVMQASGGGQGTGFQGATLRGNNSLTQNMERLRVPGTTVLADGDVIRVILPSDSVFQPGSTNFQPASEAVLNQLASVIRQYYPGQIIGVEAHWDNSSAGPSPVSHHQVTSSQALAIMSHWTQKNLLPAQQLLVMGYGSNRPRFSNATPQGQTANRRVEIVVYPDQF
jgi:flagellar motor protein MotB